jgi:hypothetical protein
MTLRKRFQVTGVVILIAGLLAAAWIYTGAPIDEASSDEFASKRYLRGMETIGGQSNAMATEFREWFGSLWHGRRLALTLAVFSLGSSAACFFLGDFLSFPYPLPPNDQNGREDA